MSTTPAESDPEAISQDASDYQENQPPIADPIPRADILRATTGHEKWTKIPKPRGRKPRHPDAQSIRIDCQSIEDFQTKLQTYLMNPTGAAEHTTVEFPFPAIAAFMVDRHRLTVPPRQELIADSSSQHIPAKTAVSTAEALTLTHDPKMQLSKQKAVVKTIVEAVEKADGYRYSYNNNWYCKEEQANRFTYSCNDSNLNKGRAASGAVGKESMKMRKPVYDCRGLISVKFSARNQNLEVHYRHMPIHATYLERAPPARRDSKRRRLTEMQNLNTSLSQQPKKTKPSREIQLNADESSESIRSATIGPSNAIISPTPSTPPTTLPTITLLDHEVMSETAIDIHRMNHTQPAPSHLNPSSHNSRGRGGRRKQDGQADIPQTTPPVPTSAGMETAQRHEQTIAPYSSLLLLDPTAAYVTSAKTPTVAIGSQPASTTPRSDPPPTSDFVLRLTSERDYWKARAEEAERMLQFFTPRNPQPTQPLRTTQPSQAENSTPRPSSLAGFGILFPPGHPRK